MLNNSTIRRSLALLGATIATTASVAGLAGGPASAATTTKPDVWSVDTGWVTTYDGVAGRAHI